MQSFNQVSYQENGKIQGLITICIIVTQLTKKIMQNSPKLEAWTKFLELPSKKWKDVVFLALLLFFYNSLILNLAWAWLHPIGNSLDDCY